MPLRAANATEDGLVQQVLSGVDVLVLTSAIREQLGERIGSGLPLMEYHNRLDEAGVEMLRQAKAAAAASSRSGGTRSRV